MDFALHNQLFKFKCIFNSLSVQSTLKGLYDSDFPEFKTSDYCMRYLCGESE